jgi:hypothetical protein
VFCRSLPPHNQDLRRALYRGQVFHLAATSASAQLCDGVLALLREQFGDDLQVRRAHQQLSQDDFLLRLSNVRKAIYLEGPHQLGARRVLAAAGFDPMEMAIDPMRLVVVAETDHHAIRAAHMYYPHRDTWFGHPSAALSFWIPLHALNESETFVFYPERFDRAVPNDSERFQYHSWAAKGWDLQIGWQDRETGQRADYPGVRGRVDCGRPTGFSCGRADVMIFSGAHFHRILPHENGLGRYTLKFRAVHLNDHSEGLGAPNVDSRARGSALVDYLAPESVE